MVHLGVYGTSLQRFFHPETKRIPTCIAYSVRLAGFPEVLFLLPGNSF